LAIRWNKRRALSSVSDWATKVNEGLVDVKGRHSRSDAVDVCDGHDGLKLVGGIGSLKLRTTTEAFVPGCGPMSQLAPADP
jgi:hypothetical protein